MITGSMVSRLNVQLQLWVPFFLAASLIMVPLSTTGKSIFIGLSVTIVAFTPDYRKDLISMLSEPWCQALLLIFFIALLACSWSPASTHEKVSVLKKYSKLLFLPLLVAGFRDLRARLMGLHAFLVAMLITCILSILKAGGILLYNGPDPSQIIHNHIMTGFMMALGVYVAAWCFLNERTKVRGLYAVLFVLFSYQILFINTGRTGYLIYFILMILLMVQILPWRKAGLAVIFVFALFVASYYQSSTMQFVSKQVAANLHEIHNGNKNNPIGYRVQFHEYAKNLLLRHPWFGNGTGSYTYYFSLENPVPAWHKLRHYQNGLVEPHSQYWFAAAEFGVVGVLALIFFFASLLAKALRLHSMRAIAIAVLISFTVASLSDSLLFYSGTGYLFLLFMAMCLGEQQELSSQKT